jgi:NADH dehydrogenase
MSENVHTVTGAFGYSGRYIARDLLARGAQVRTLTNHPDKPHPFRDRFADRIEVAPLDFTQPAALAQSLQGTDVLYNTYWVRFSHGEQTHHRAVEHTRILIQAACDAGVRRIVHVSIANPDPKSPLPYYRGKAEIEAMIQSSGLSYAILRPAVLFGGETPAEDVLLNNIAWLLRRFPIFAIPGDGRYRLQPIHVEDLARLAVEYGERQDNVVLDAVGPEIYTFDELVILLKRTVGSRAALIHVPPGLALTLARIIGLFVGDVVLTPEEVDGLMSDLLVSDQTPNGSTRLSKWLAANRDLIGARYASELARHYGKTVRVSQSRFSSLDPDPCLERSLACSCLRISVRAVSSSSPRCCSSEGASAGSVDTPYSPARSLPSSARCLWRCRRRWA